MKSSSCIRISQLSLGLLWPRSAVASALLGDVLGPVGQTSKDFPRDFLRDFPGKWRFIVDFPIKNG